MKILDILNERTDQSSAEAIISGFKAGKLTYQEAGKRLKDTGNSNWMNDLNRAHKRMKTASLQINQAYDQRRKEKDLKDFEQSKR